MSKKLFLARFKPYEKKRKPTDDDGNGKCFFAFDLIIFVKIYKSVYFYFFSERKVEVVMRDGNQECFQPNFTDFLNRYFMKLYLIFI